MITVEEAISISTHTEDSFHFLSEAVSQTIRQHAQEGFRWAKYILSGPPSPIEQYVIEILRNNGFDVKVEVIGKTIMLNAGSADMVRVWGLTISW